MKLYLIILQIRSDVHTACRMIKFAISNWMA